MSPSLFDEIERQHLGPAREDQSLFDYLNLSARDPIGTMRQTYDAWFSRWPPQDQESFRSRFRSRDQCESTLFELLLHEALLRLSFEIAGEHPSVPGTSKHPEFLAVSGTERVYVEATVARGLSREQQGIEAAKDAFIDGLNHMDSPNFFIEVQFIETPKGPPPIRQARCFLDLHLKTLDPDQVEDRLTRTMDYRSLPYFRFQEEGWSVDLYAMPKPVGARNDRSLRNVSGIWTGTHEIDAITPIRKAIRSKSTRYGELGLPYVIALNYVGESGSEDDVIQALFGNRYHTYIGHPSKTVVGRRRNGCWHPRHNTRVSGILFFRRLGGHDIADAEVRLYHNPWARHPYEGHLCEFPQMVPVPEDRSLRAVDGRSLSDVLGLPNDWPGLDENERSAPVRLPLASLRSWRGRKDLGRGGRTVLVRISGA